MPISDALVVGEDWISEHYFTADATKETFQGKVLERRKAWEAEEAATTRSRFVAARGELERRLVSLTEGIDEDDVETSPRPLTAEQRKAVGELDDLLLDVLGYRTGEYALRDEGPITWIAPPSIPENPPLAIVRARPQATVDDLVAKKAPTLLTPWEREGQEPITSVSLTLTTLLTDADGPAFVLVLAGRWCLIAEKERWPEGRWLAVDLQLVCERNDAKRGGEIDRALACLDAASLAPDASGTTWWRETLDDSVKHTVGVSKDLREGVRLSIEILANEVLQRRAAQGLEPLPADQAQPLAIQCLRYLYRILFLLYAEASPELGVLPVGAQEYDAGYGLDRLRDLALTEIHSERARTGTHLYESLDRLFVLVDRGHTPAGDEQLPDGLEFQGLRADLFQPEATAHIDATKLGNEALLQVLRKLLLSKESAKQQRGFISYVELGISQLGAVYEGLMSYTGSFATEDLFEVAKNGDPSKGSWVVPTHRSDHLSEDDFVKVRNGDGVDEPVVHRKGTFVFRLSGRDRQRSASYYTPEVLTKFTVQQALEELLDQDGHRTTAAEILELTVCEPALGSGAFAIEAVRQLAEQYISRREEELDRKVDPEDRPHEVQKVKAHIALHQVYGVDLNATAVELAEVSIWLDTMVAGLSAPWFGLRLRRGNSLVGARHALYGPTDVAKKTWLKTPPKDRPLSDLAAAIEEDRTLDVNGYVHHFLLPAQGWGSAVEVPKAVRDLVPDETLKRLKTWRTSIRKAPTKAQIKQLQALSMRVETLWGIALRRLQFAEAEASRAIDLWQRPGEPPTPSTVTREQIEASLADPDGAYRRLRTLMDVWCALWFWPLTPTETDPPSLDQWLDACQLIVGTPDLNPRRRQTESFADMGTWDALNQAEDLDREFSGARPLSEVHSTHPWLTTCDAIADQQGFFHWELDFASVFAHGGFDLQVGNPPWVRPDVSLEPLYADFDPWWGLALKPPQDEKQNRATAALQHAGAWRTVITSTGDTTSLAEFLTDPALFPHMCGRPDLYRGFMNVVWRNQGQAGFSGLIHLESHFTDNMTAPLRKVAYRHLRRHWQFINELGLFEIQNQKTFGVNVYGSDREPYFLQATFLYTPETVLRSLKHTGGPDVPGLKDVTGEWDIRPHAARIQIVDTGTLQTWAEILSEPRHADTAMVYAVNQAAQRMLDHLKTMPRIADLQLEYSLGWDETAAAKRGRFETRWGVASWDEAILQGPHLFVANPQYKNPNSTMLHNVDWTAIDLETMALDALPVTSFKITGDRVKYDAEYSHWGASKVPSRDFYRVAWRCMSPNTAERTLAPAIIPPGCTHVGGINSASHIDSPASKIPLLAGVLSSLLADFSVRAAPKSNIRAATINRLPRLPLDHPLNRQVILRILRLNCLTDAYADLWAECWEQRFLEDEAILPRFDEKPIGPAWTPETPLRRAADRRNAQVEIDAMVAIMLRVPIEDLCTIYRTQFPVLYGYDHREYTYDMNGRLVPYEVLNRWRKQGGPQDPAQMSEQDRTAIHPGSGVAYTYIPPFTTYDREADFRLVADYLQRPPHRPNANDNVEPH